MTIVAGKQPVIQETKARPPAQPPFGTLRTENSDQFATVFVNGHFMGHVDEFSNFAQGPLLNPGTHDVKIVRTRGQGEVTKTRDDRRKSNVVVK